MRSVVSPTEAPRLPHVVAACWGPSSIRPRHLQPLLFCVLHLFASTALCALQPCPPCGNLTVPYPFSTSPGCGHPRYGLSCNPSSSQLQLHGIFRSYTVRDIIPSSQLLTIVPAPLLPSGSSCISEDLVYGGLLLKPTDPFTVTTANTLFLFNCTGIVFGSPYNCSANNLCYETAMDSSNSPCKSLLCCMLRKATGMQLFGYALNESFCSAYTSVVGLDDSLARGRWNYGVQLQWDSPKEPPCAHQKQCPLDSVCRRNETGIGMCQCNLGFHWSPLSGLCEEGFLLRYRAALIAGLTPTLLFLSVIFSLAIYKFHKKRSLERQAQAMVLQERSWFLSSNGGKATLFTAKELRAATDNYRANRLLGRGGFGEVFKGELRDGTPVAVKVARFGRVKGDDQVLNEVRILSQVNHRNLVRLLGCCIDAEQAHLVYEFVPNGTLMDRLRPGSAAVESSEQSKLNWEARLRIAKETADGLSYLHCFAYPSIIHRDVKSANILLDANMTAKVSDFGLSRFLENDATHVSTYAQGTMGYVDPHYFRTHVLSDKSDVYSFGVVLLELVTSQQVIDFTRGSDNVCLTSYVSNRYDAGYLEEVLDTALVQTARLSEIVSMRDLAVLAMACLDKNSAKRPRMAEVAHQIDCMLRELQRCQLKEGVMERAQTWIRQPVSLKPTTGTFGGVSRTL